MEALGFFLYPLAACVLLILMHTYFGIHILERGIIFVDLSLAQFIGIGIAVSCLTGHGGSGEFIYPVVFAVLGAFILSLSRRIGKYTNIEAFIGVLYIFSLAASILILDRSPHGVEEFKNLLNGNIIWVNGRDIVSTAVLYGIIGIFHGIYRKSFFRLSRTGEGGFIREFLFFCSFAVVLIKSVQMAGILLVFFFPDHSGTHWKAVYPGHPQSDGRGLAPGSSGEFNRPVCVSAVGSACRFHDCRVSERLFFPGAADTDVEETLTGMT